MCTIDIRNSPLISDPGGFSIPHPVCMERLICTCNQSII